MNLAIAERVKGMPTYKPTKKEVKPFIEAIKEAAADLDWALRCYSITLKELGLNEQQIVEKLREVFFQIAGEVVKT